MCKQAHLDYFNVELLSWKFYLPNTDLIEVEDRYDGCHLSGRGLEKHADAWFRIVKNHIKK